MSKQESLQEKYNGLRKSYEFQAARVQQLEEVLREVLSKFPTNDVLEAITPPEAASVRSCPLVSNTSVKVADVYRWRAALADGREPEDE